MKIGYPLKTDLHSRYLHSYLFGGSFFLSFREGCGGDGGVTETERQKYRYRIRDSIVLLPSLNTVLRGGGRGGDRETERNRETATDRLAA